MPHQSWLFLIPPDATAINNMVSFSAKNEKIIYYLSAYQIFGHSEVDQKSKAMMTSSLVCSGYCKQTEIAKAFGFSKNTVKRNVRKYLEEGPQGFFMPRKGRGGSVLKSDTLAKAQELLHQGKDRKEVAKELCVKADTLRKAIKDGRLIMPSCSVENPKSLDSIKTALPDLEGDLEIDNLLENVFETETETEAEAEAEIKFGKSKIEAAIEPRVRTTIEPTVKTESVIKVVPTKSTDKSTRAIIDKEAALEMGTACTRVVERACAAVGIGAGAVSRFEACKDVANGGVLCALPALAVNGLFSHINECFKPLSGYYRNSQHIFLVVAFMALCRIKSAEKLQQNSPGEFGKLLGLDRVPEVKAFRKKLDDLCQEGFAEKWASLLCHDWMEKSPELAGTLYIDGHVRVYHGSLTKLPKRYVSRDKLCLRGITDYWVNDALGQPFFAVEKTVDHGMLEALRNDIVPRLLQDIPNQPTEEDLAADPNRFRFVLVFDREGYSPEFFKEMWNNHRIACITYRKFAKKIESWPVELFEDKEVDMPDGERLILKLAQKVTYIGDKKNGLQVKEIRKLNPSGHQTSLISSAYDLIDTRTAALLFSRWAQENFFAYMMKHFAIDRLCEIGVEKFPEPPTVVNPAWREADRNCRITKRSLDKCQAQYKPLFDLTNKNVLSDEKKKRELAELVEQIEQFDIQLKTEKELRAQIPKHINWNELPEDQKFLRLQQKKKRFTDTIKMISYRAETAMVNSLRECMARKDDARSLIQGLLIADADLCPDTANNILLVKIHGRANPRTDAAVSHLLEHLNECDFVFPGTSLHLRYQILSSD